MKFAIKSGLFIFILLINIGCASKAPDTYNGASTNYDADYFDTNRSIEFKYAFRYLMPPLERDKFENTLKNSNYKSNNWTQKMQSEGFNALAISATGTSALSGEGQAAGLALSLVDDYLSGRSEKQRFSYMVFSDEWLDSHVQDAEEAHSIAREKTLAALHETATAFDYKIVCIANCNERMPTFELISTNQGKYINQFHPEKLSLVLYLSELEKIESDATERKTFSQDSNFQAKYWEIHVTGNDSGFTYVTKDVPGGTTGIYKQETYVLPTTDYDINQTPLGRKFFRLLSSKMTNWVVADIRGNYELALLNGELYHPVNMSSAKSFNGARTKEDN